jgi:hypothetical protein
MTTTQEALVTAAREAVGKAGRNAELRRGEVVLHASDWLAVQDAIAALTQQPAITEQGTSSPEREALQKAHDAIAEYYRYWTGGETRGSYDGKPERAGLWEAQRAARTALSSNSTDQQDRSRAADDTFGANNSELEPDGKQNRESSSADRQGGGCREVGGRPAVLSSGVQCRERDVRGEDCDQLSIQGGVEAEINAALSGAKS